MTSSEFTDTNILLYAHDLTAEPKRRVALSLLDRLWGEGGGLLSVQVLCEFFHNATRKLGLPHAEARATVTDFSGWSVYSPGAEDVLAAIELARSATVSFWDALLIRAASQSNATILWTEDLQDGRRFGSLEVRNPFRA